MQNKDHSAEAQSRTKPSPTEEQSRTTTYEDVQCAILNRLIGVMEELYLSLAGSSLNAIRAISLPPPNPTLRTGPTMRDGFSLCQKFPEVSHLKNR